VTATATTDELEHYRRELTGYCYRMLGSAFEADDAVQETMLRAWKAAEGFEGRSSLRSWLYRIATNVCLDTLRGEKRRALPMDLGPASPPLELHMRPSPAEDLWVTPIPDARVVPDHGDPAEIAAVRESVRLAFVTALQHLPPRQRAVLVLRDVLGFRAAEAAEILGCTLDAANNSLKRARATVAGRLPRGERDRAPLPGSARERAVVARFTDTFERGDVDGIVALLTEDAWLRMPPLPFEYQGRATAGEFLTAISFRHGKRQFRLVPTRANGQPAFGCYLRDPHAPISHAHGLIVLTLAGDQISVITRFLDNSVLPKFGLPRTLPE
jgi:RNA polymerase sigma-70 factor (ECF subfamily)